MYKLSAMDAAFLYNETARSPQHIASVQILELPEGVSGREFVANLKSLLMERIHLVPYLTNKLQFVPFDLDHPVWVHDRNFDIDNHVHLLELPVTRGKHELETAIARLHEIRLDRSRPLWDLWVLTGLKGGRIAYYNRAHHACLDGVAGQAALETTMDLTPTPRVVDPAPEGFFGRHDEQTPAQLIVGAIENFAKYQAKQLLAAFNSVETAARLFQRTFDPRKGLGAVAQRAPATRFNRAVQQKRSYAVGELRLETVKNIARLTEAKVNDVFLAACAGGLRRQLDRMGELPMTPLIAGCPVSLRQPGDTSADNQVTMMMVSLATDESNPADRLQTIAQSARTAKGFTQDIAGSFDADVAVPGLPATLSTSMRLAELTRVANLPRLPLPCNVVISNVPGPQQTLYSCGARVTAHYPVSIPAHTQGVNITVHSYTGMLYFGVTACAKALPNPEVLVDDILIAFKELRDCFDLPSVSVTFEQPTAEQDGPDSTDVARKASDAHHEAA